MKWILLAVAGGAAVIAVVSYLITQAADPFRTAQPLDIPSYAQSASSLRGNKYKITGEINDALGWSPTAGRLVSVLVTGTTRILPVQVTREFNSVNIQKGQQFNFLVEVDEKGILRTKDLKIQ